MRKNISSPRIEPYADTRLRVGVIPYQTLVYIESAKSDAVYPLIAGILKRDATQTICKMRGQVPDWCVRLLEMDTYTPDRRRAWCNWLIKNSSIMADIYPETPLGEQDGISY
jgi:hypothetical protein